MNYFLLKDGKKTEIYDDPNREPVLNTPGRNVIKITAGEKFIITKCGGLEWLRKEISSTYGKYQRRGIADDNFYIKLIQYCYKNQINKLIFEVVYNDENGYNVLKKELELLQENFGKKDCLNINNIPYIPKTIHAKQGSNWLKQNEYLNFMKLLKNYEY